MHSNLMKTTTMSKTKYLPQFATKCNLQ